MGREERAAFKRLGRGVISLLLSTLVAWFTKRPEAIAAAPAINACGKYLRAKLDLPNIPF